MLHKYLGEDDLHVLERSYRQLQEQIKILVMNQPSSLSGREEMLHLTVFGEREPTELASLYRETRCAVLGRISYRSELYERGTN